MVLRAVVGVYIALAAACVFDPSGVASNDGAVTPQPDAASNDGTVTPPPDAASDADVALDIGSPDVVLDVGTFDVGTPDAALDVGTFDVGTPDVVLDVGTPDAALDVGSPDVAGPPDAPPPSDAPTIFRKSITIGGGTVGSNLTDFPLYVALPNDTDLHDHASSGGSDIAFFAADGTTQLDYEIDTWVPASGTLLAWVRVPTLSAAASTTIYVRYGAPPVQPSNPADVWKNGFLAVFHLREDPANTIADSTGAHNGAAAGGMSSSDLVPAKLGDGLELDGNNNVVNFGNPYQGGGEHTISAWVSQENTTDNDALIVLGTGGSTDKSRFLHSRFFSGDIAVGLYNDDWTTNHDIQGDGFVLVHWTYTNNDQSRLYVDGVLVDGPHTHNGSANTQGTEGRIGNAPSAFGNNMGFNGIVDEVHLASVARSAAWIAAEFANQSSPGTFYQVGTEEAL